MQGNFSSTLDYIVIQMSKTNREKSTDQRFQKKFLLSSPYGNLELKPPMLLELQNVLPPTCACLQNSSPWNPSLPWNSKMLPMVWVWIFFWNHPISIHVLYIHIDKLLDYTVHLINFWSIFHKLLELSDVFYCRYPIRIQKLFDWKL